MSEEESSDDKKNLDFSKDVKEKPAKPKRVASRFFNALLAVVFFILFVMSVVSFSSFSNNYREITDTVYGDSACVLYATYNEEDNDQDDDPQISLGAVGFCRLGIGGEVVIAIYCILSIVVMVIKIIGGWSILSCFLVFELITVFVMTLLSFCIGVVISVGRKVTCDSLKDSDQDDASSCSGYKVPESSFKPGERVQRVQFLKEIEIAEATAWLGFGILVVILVFYIICVVMYGYGRKQAKTAKKNAIDKEKAKNQKELEDKA